MQGFKALIPPFVFLILSLPFIGCKKSNNTLFQEMTADYTGIDFVNKIVQNDSFNILQFEYMYNGAGVAISDFDLDGLQDIYFTGNMTSSRLYRNLGNFKFQDITKSAKVGSTDWCNGVSVVDINQDGYPDIYISKAGPRNATNKALTNLLYINNGVKDGSLSFTEEAKMWGLADTSYSVQAAFLDYDGDGDLDMYLLNNALVNYNRNTARPKNQLGSAPSMDKLFRNNGDKTFTEVSKAAGIVFEGFGLGVQVCDLNTDGWPDIYVSNDFLTEDILYINQKDGTFKNQIGDYMQHLTFNGMGNDIADLNNDGLMDVMVLDMLPPDNKRWKLTMVGNNYDQFQNTLDHGYLPQYIRNTLQFNNGNGTFSEIGQMTGVSATEWSWSPLLADFDQDGSKDIFITNGYGQDITNLDFMVYGSQELAMGTKEANQKKRLEKLNTLSGIKLHNFMFRNHGNLEFKDISVEAGFSKPTYSNGAAYADLDNDGDLDLVINNIDDPAGIYKNQMEINFSNNYIKFLFEGKLPNRQGLGSEVEVYCQDNFQKQYFTPYRGYLSTMEQALHFGLGKAAKIDSIKVTWPDGKIQKIKNLKANQVVTLKYTDAHIPNSEYNRSESHQLLDKVNDLGLNFIHKEDDFVDFKVQPLLPHMHSRNGPGLAVSDVNRDGLEDIFIGGALGQSASIMLQKPDGQFVPSLLDNENYEDMAPLFFDADNDGDQDLYVVSGGSSKPAGAPHYRDQLYQNDGKGNFKLVPGLPETYVSGSVVTAADYDKDGDLDLFVGGRVKPGEYPLPTPSLLLKNTSTPNNIKFVKDRQAVNNIFEGLGMVTSALWTDFNNDSWQDLIVVGEFMPIRIFKNDRGILSEITESTGLKNTHGWWNSINHGDFDNDGDTDYILGNLGLNSRFKASAKEPLCIYANDYDKNGQIDPVMCYYINGKNHVAHSRKDLIDQINAMRGRFRTYSDYANTTFDESFTKEEIKNGRLVLVACHHQKNGEYQV